MQIPWQRESSRERQQAAAELWMDLTGRTRKEAAAVAFEKLAAVAEERRAPRLRVPTAAGAAGGGVAGAALGAQAARVANRGAGKKISVPKAGLGGGTVGSGVGAALGLGYGVHLLRKSLEKTARDLSMGQKRLIGGTAGAAAAGSLGGLWHYLGARPSRSGKSKHEIDAEVALAALRARLGAQGGDASAAQAAQLKYRQMLLEHSREAREAPVQASMIGSLPYAAVGGTIGAYHAPRVL